MLVQAVLAVSLCALPKEFTGIFTEEKDRVVKNWHMFFCVCTGLWGGLIIGLVTEYYTSNAFQPVQVYFLLPVVHDRQKQYFTSIAVGALQTGDLTGNIMSYSCSAAQVFHAGVSTLCWY